MTLFEAIILGAVQGVTEWLPISSEGMIVLVKTNFFGGAVLADIIRTALFLHLGTFLAALIYFRRDVKDISLRFFGKGKNAEAGNILRFIIIATLVSAVLGWILLEVLADLESSVLLTAKFINMAIAALLVITGIVQLKKKKNGGLRLAKDGLRPADGGHKSTSELSDCDSVTLGIVQGAAVLPGLSRSGLTVSALLLRNFQDTEALRLSFLLSLPIVLGGNILLNFNQAVVSLNNFVALLFSFIFGYITINLFLKLAEKVNFGWFAVIFSALVFFAILI